MSAFTRLQRGDDFQRVRRVGRAYHHPWVTLSTAPNELPISRFGFITSKQLGNAVRRNRIRRQLREIVRLNLGQVKQGHDLVWIARPAVIGKPYAEIQSVCIGLLERARLLQPKATSEANIADLLPVASTPITRPRPEPPTSPPN